MDELPYWRVVMRRERDHDGMREIADAHGPVIDEMRAALRERGTVTNADFAARGAPALDHYRGGKATSLALYYLWRTGEAMTHHRERFQRVYAPAEDVTPANLLIEAPDGIPIVSSCESLSHSPGLGAPADWDAASAIACPSGLTCRTNRA